MFLRKLLAFEIPDAQNTDSLVFKGSFLTLAILVVFVLALTMGIYYWQISPLDGSVNFGIAVYHLGLYLFLKRFPEKVEVISSVVIVSWVIACFAIYLLVRVNPLRLVVFFPMLIAIFYLKGFRVSVYWIVLILIGIPVGHLLPGYENDYAHVEILVVCVYLLATSVIFWNFELLRQAQMKRERDLELQQLIDERWRLALESAGDAVWDFQIQTRQFVYSKCYAEMLGYTPDELVDRPDHMESILHPQDRQPTLASINAYLRGDCSGQYVCEHRLLCKDGSYKWFLSRGRVTERDAAGRPLRMLGTHVDITDRKELEQQVRQLALYDALTGLPNRRLLNDRLLQAMAASERSGLCMALMFFDLDNFKPLNDVHGHGVGDLLLVEVARRVIACVRKSDTVARFGGDEFVVLVTEIDTDTSISMARARDVAEKVRISLAAPYQLSTAQTASGETTVVHQCSASIGVAMTKGFQTDVSEWMKQADGAMYQAKAAGRNAICFFDRAAQP